MIFVFDSESESAANDDKTDPVATSIEIHVQPTSHTELYNKMQEGIRDISLGNTRPFAEAMANVKVKRSK